MSHNCRGKGKYLSDLEHVAFTCFRGPTLARPSHDTRTTLARHSHDTRTTLARHSHDKSNVECLDVTPIPQKTWPGKTMQSFYYAKSSLFRGYTKRMPTEWGLKKQFPDWRRPSFYGQ